MKKTFFALALLCLTAAGCPDRAKVLIIGDSISMGYIPYIREIFNGAVDIMRPEGNCGGTLRGVQHIDEWLALEDVQWDVIHFNFGLHDLKHVDPATGKATSDPGAPNEQTPWQYAANLEYIIGKMKTTGARLVFATTTPFYGTQSEPYRDSVQVAAYNAAAMEVCLKNGVAVNDLCGYVLANPEMMRRDNVHFFAPDSRALAGQVCNAVLKQLAITPVRNVAAENEI
jgi:acyl-CoA thioesterase-1